MRIWADLETRSSVAIRLGNVKYATNVEIIMLQWAIDNGPLRIVDMTNLDHRAHQTGWDEFKYAVKLAKEVWAHQAEFDRTVVETTDWWKQLRIHPTKWRCTAALARMHGLPGGLDKLCQIFKVPEDKAKLDGKDHIQLFCKPYKGKYNDRFSHPKEWKEFLEYGGRDVEAMRYIWTKLPKWNGTSRMWRGWDLDYRMNHRGVAMDVDLAVAMLRDAGNAKNRMAARTAELTDDAVERTTQRDRLLNYMREYGVDLPDLTADTVERRLDDESLPENIKELLRIRQQASKASTSKCKRILDQHVNGRLFNLLVFCGAMRTGRWAGRTFQPQNLPRPKHSPKVIELAIKAFKGGYIDLVDRDDVMGLASSCLRGLIIPGKGRRLVSADLANIEGRYMAWVAGEDWKLEAFAAYDRKEGPDLYKVSYARAFNIDPSEIGDDDQRRQIGKVMELALQYYGGVGAFCSMAETYGLRLDKLAIAAWSVLPLEVKRASKLLWEKAKKRNRTYGLPERTWIVCQSLVTLWREAHPCIVAFWEALDNAVKSAIASPGIKFMAGEHISVDRIGNWLRIRLPSGRYLNYPAPRVVKVKDKNGRVRTVTRSFIGVNPYTRQWGRITTYSGKDAENVCQGGCADILMDGLLAADDAGYNPVLSVHDEAITEPPDTDEFTDKELSRLLVSASKWAVGMPMAAKGKISYRYSK